MRNPYGGYHGGYGQQGEHEYRGSYGELHRGAQGGFMEELREWAYGRKAIPEEFKAVVCSIMKEQTDNMLGQYGYTQQGSEHGSEHHHRYKETLEELRDVPSIVDAEKKFDHYFSDLTSEDKKVLKAEVNRPSMKKLAQMSNMTLDRFMEVKRGLEHKLK